jgi:hypothetical protein
MHLRDDGAVAGLGLFAVSARAFSLDPAHPFAGPALRAMAGDATALEEASEVFHRAEVRCGIGLTFPPKRGPYAPLRDEDVPLETVFEFLDATSLVVDGNWLQQLLLLDRTGHERLFSFREWGHHVAAWVNQRQPSPTAGLPRRSPSPCGCVACASAGEGNFDYLDFYNLGYVTRVFPDYVRWLAVVEQVLTRKLARFGEPFASEAR